MAKDKKKKKKDKGDGKARKSRGGADALKALAQNPLVADVVAAALVATSAALKDSRKAQRLAAEASDELEALAKKGAEQGKAAGAPDRSARARRADGGTREGDQAEGGRKTEANR